MLKNIFKEAGKALAGLKQRISPEPDPEAQLFADYAWRAEYLPAWMTENDAEDLYRERVRMLFAGEIKGPILG